MNWLNPLGAPAARHPAPVLPVGTTSSGSRSRGLRGWPAAGALARPLTAPPAQARRLPVTRRQHARRVSRPAAGQLPAGLAG